MKRLLLIASLCASGAFAQSMTTVTANAVYDWTGGVMKAGQICFVPSVTITAQASVTAFTRGCGTIQWGVLSGTLQVPNLMLATPANASYTISVTNSDGVVVLYAPGIQTVAGSLFSYDLFSLPASVTALGTGLPAHLFCSTGAVFTQLDAVDNSKTWNCISNGWQNPKQRIVPPSVYAGGSSSGGNTAGSNTNSIRTIRASETLKTSDYTVLVNAAAGPVVADTPFTPTLGEILIIKKIDATSNAVRVHGNGVLVDGNSSYTLHSKGNSVQIQFDGTGWWVL